MINGVDKFNHRMGLTATLLLSAAWCVQPAFAQNESGQGADQSAVELEEIVVTAQRRAENLQDVPVAVTALTAESLDAKGIASTTDLTSVTPGLTYTTIAGAALPRIRGVGASIALGGNENPIATYVDGVYIASSSGSVLSFNNIEQIAVLKGPQGTLFGRNATGGLIQITTRDPKSTLSAQASATYGNRDTIGGNLYLTGGLADGLAADVAVYYNNQQNGFGRNLVTGNDVNKSRDFAIRSKWVLEAGPDTTIKLAVDYSRTRVVGPAFRSTYGSTPVNGVPFAGGKFDIANELDPITRKSQGGASLNVSHDFGGVSLLSITAYRKARFHAIFDIDKLPIHGARSNLNTPDRQFSQELQLLSEDEAPFRWVLGAYLFKARSAYDPLIIDRAANDTAISSRQKTESYAVFGQATYNLTESTGLTAGLRYTNETKNYAASGSGNVPNGSPPPTSPVARGRLEASKLTWRVALDHHLNDDVLGYLSYNRGFKSGGFNPQSFAAPLNVFQPEVLDAVELGLKADLFDRRLRLNTAGFYYDYKNIQINSFVGGVSTIFNAASAEIYGLDFDLTAAPIRRLTLTAGLSLIHGRFGRFPNAVTHIPLQPGGVGNSQPQQVDASGNRLPITPDWTLNLGADYSVPLANGSLAFSVNYFHSDGWRAEPDNRIGQGPYDLFNASATWFIDADENYSVKLWGKNLGNEAYAVQMNAQPQSDGIAVGPGRTYGVTLGARF